MKVVCIVVARFYQDIAHELVRGAVARLEKSGVSYEIIDVPGAFEIPAAISMAMASDKYAGFIALGCVIRGETTHYDYVCAESARGINQLAMDHLVAIGYGILTVENEAQAWARARVGEGNKGADAAHACLHMMALQKTLGII